MDNKEKNTELERILMTREEFQKEQRLGIRKWMQRIAMAVGVAGIFVLLLGGIFEPFFEITFFGRIFTPDKFKDFWGTDAMGYTGLVRRSGIYEDWLNMGTWLPKIGITVVYLAVILGFVYFFTYMAVDLIAVVKSIGKGVKEITVGLNENVKVSYEAETKPKKKEKKEEKVEEIEEPKKEVEKKPTPKKTQKPQSEKPKKEPVVKEKRRREEESEYSDEQLAAMLRGEDINPDDTSNLDALFDKS